MKISKGDIILVSFPYTNLHRSKLRPALVISTKVDNGEDVIICGITSKKHGSQEIVLEEKDFTEGTLPIKSYIRFAKIVTIEKSIIKQNVGKLNKKKIAEIISKLKDLL